MADSVLRCVRTRVAFERLYFIMFRANINGTAFGAIQKLIMANNIDRAISFATRSRSLPRVLKAGLTRANRSEIGQNAVDESFLRSTREQADQLPSMLANVAT